MLRNSLFLQEVMEAVAGADIVLLCGETGCGKTTQVGG